MKLFYGNSIKIYRKQHKLNQEELARNLKISKSMLGMLENNNRNASEEVEKKIKLKLDISLDKELQKHLLNEYQKELIELFNIKTTENRLFPSDLRRNIKKLNEISKMYYSELGENDFAEITKVLNKLPVYLPHIHTFTYKYYNKNDNLKLFYKTYTAFLLDNTDNIIEIINSYFSKDEKEKDIIVFKDKLPLNIRSDFDKIIKSINSTTYADYTTYSLNSYSFEKQLGFIINDDSMSPKYEIGNIIIINILLANTMKSIENNKDYLIKINKEFIIRRIQIENEQILLKPLNFNYDVKTYTKDNLNNSDIEIIGKITDIKIN